MFASLAGPEFTLLLVCAGFVVTGFCWLDLFAGSALGFILVTGVAIPVIGIQSSIFLLSSLIFAGLLFGTIGNKL